MTATVIVRIKSVQYSGESVGRDIRIDLLMPDGKSARVERTIKPGTTAVLNREVARFETMEDPFPLGLQTKVTEKDLVFNDTGETRETFSIHTGSDDVTERSCIIQVSERRISLRKVVAVFTIVFEIEVRAHAPRKKVPTVEHPEWTGDFQDDTEHMLLARAIFGEARSTKLSDSARIAIGWSIRNRVDDPKGRYGGTYHAVILKPKQYGAFNSKDPNRPYVENPLRSGSKADVHAWEICYKIAGDVINESVPDPTHGSNHYFDDSIQAPSWAKEKNFKVKIGPFFFYAL